MKPIDRMTAVYNNAPPDRHPFVPSVYEHGAYLLGKSPGEVCRDVELTAVAALKAYESYQHDLVTVGVDIYNLEAEAFGCPISAGEGTAIPGVTGHPLAAAEVLDASELDVPSPGPGNRLDLIIEASRRVVGELGDDVWVYTCLGGPFSQAVELRGMENLIVDMMTDPASVHALLEKTTELSMFQAERAAREGCSCNLFESWATLPLIDPNMFAEYVVPYNKRIISKVRENYDCPPPAVIMGGDTALLMDHFIEAGTSLVVADYMTDFDFMREKTRGRHMMIRGCADPKMIERGDWAGVERAVATLAEKAKGMNNFVWGCGAVSYNTTADQVLRFRELCLDNS